VPDESVLLVNLTPEEIRHSEDLLSHFDLGTGSIAVPSIGDAERYFKQGDLLLVILRESIRKDRIRTSISLDACLADPYPS
jgi:hypothetical protein